jgi:hypothetical protein
MLVRGPLLLGDCNITSFMGHRERGVSRAVEILSGREMLSAVEFAKFIGVSREAVRGKHQRHEVLGLHGAKEAFASRNGR